MKYYIPAFFFLIMFTACKKSNTAPKATVSIVGKWNHKSERTQVFSSTGAVVSDETDTSFPAVAYLEYNADGTGEANEGGDIFDFTYAINGNTDTEYQTPTSQGEQPYVFTIAFTATTLTRTSKATANNQSIVYTDVYTR